MICKKKPFQNRKKAKAVLKEIKKKKSSKRTEQAYYYCEECQAYHLTSMSKKKSRKLTRTINYQKQHNESKK